MQGNGIVLKYFLQPNKLFGNTLEETEGTFRVAIQESDWLEEIEEIGKAGKYDINPICKNKILPTFLK